MFRLARGVGAFLCVAAVSGLHLEAARAADGIVQPPPAAARDEGKAAAQPPAPTAGFAAKPDAGPVPRSIYPQVHLQQPSAGYRSVPLAASDAETRARKVIDAALATGVAEDLEFTAMPLRDAVRTLEEDWNLSIRLHHKAFDEAGIDHETPVTTSVAKGETLRSALCAVLDDIDLTWVVKGERLLITTKEKAEEHMTTRLYPLPFGTANPPVDYQGLIETITNTIGGPAVWADYGGNGQIRPVEGGEPLLVIMQTEEVHGAIDALLRGMHERAMAEFLDADGQPRQTPVVKLYRCPDKDVRNDLVTNLAAICNASLAADGDPAAKVTALAGNLVVQSAKADFHALAAQIVAATVGVQPRPTTAPGGNFCGGMGGSPPQPVPQPPVPPQAANKGGSFLGGP